MNEQIYRKLFVIWICIIGTFTDNHKIIMSILLNLILLIICLVWLYKRMDAKPQLSITRVVLLFQMGVIFVFFFSLFMENDYLDGVHHIINGMATMVLFWFISMIAGLIIQIKSPSNKNIIKNFSLLSSVLIIPAILLYSWVSSSPILKIGG